MTNKIDIKLYFYFFILTHIMKSFSLFLILFLTISLSSCKKVEGEGGAATISGSLLGKKYNGVGTLIAEYPLAKHDVFIIYGTNSTYFDDKIETSYDGSFEFRNLQPGNYTIFCYEKDNTEPSGDGVVIQTVTIEKKKDNVNIGIIEVED